MLKSFQIAATTFVLMILFAHVVEARNDDVGETIFKHEWQPQDPKSPNGDGLGPVFNAQSCAQCHHQGGHGGGGDLKFNLDLIYSEANTKSEQKHLSNIHPGFRADNGDFQSMIVMHRFSLDEEYSHARSAMLAFDGAMSETQQDAERLQWGMSTHPLQLVHFAADTPGLRIQRNTPALFGIGLIDKVTLRQLTDVKIETRSPNVTGSPAILVNRMADVGRFGWRAQVNSLESFVAMACASELGLENSVQSQIIDPRAPDYQAPGQDISNTDLMHLVNFVKSLPRPEIVMPEDPELAQHVAHGRKVFHGVGCTDCHVENRAGIREIYSDLLLHDMGPRLADPILPAPKRANLTVGRLRGADIRLVDTDQDGAFDMTIFAQSEAGAGAPPVAEGATMIGYYGGFSPLPPPQEQSFGEVSFSELWARAKRQERAKKQAELDIPELAREWRTPPLWGVASSAPYMHDGRAETILEAILLHGGEAQDSVNAFLKLTNQEQAMLLDFMQALQAPRMPKPAVAMTSASPK